MMDVLQGASEREPHCVRESSNRCKNPRNTKRPQIFRLQQSKPLRASFLPMDGIVGETDELSLPSLQHGSSLQESVVQVLSEPEKYAPERRRWAVLAAFFLANLSNAALWTTFAPIASLAETYYGVSDTAINAFAVSYLAAYIPGSILALAVYSFRKDGLRIGIILATVMTCLGAFLRYLGSKKQPIYGMALAGQFLAALAQPFLTNVPPKVSAAWFPTTERDVATVLGSMANPVGTAIGSILPAIMVQENDGTIQGMDTLLLVEAILAAVGAVVAFVLVKSRPSMPPSASAEKEALIESSDPVLQVLSTNVMLCMRNRHFLVLFIAFGIGLGLFNALATLVEQLIQPFCYTDDDASLFSGLLLGCGLVMSGVVGVYLDKSHRYQFVLKLLFSLASLALLLYTLVLRPNATAALATTFALLGAVMLPILPTTLEAAVECTYPVPEEYSTGLIMSAGMATGICYIFGLEHLADVQPTCKDNPDVFYVSPASVVLLASALVATCVAFRFQGPLLRLEAEINSDERFQQDVPEQEIVMDPLLFDHEGV